MYTTVVRRRFDPTRVQETRARAEREFFPKLQRAPGFIGFYLVADEEQGVNTAISVWENKESAEAFRSEAETWTRTLESMGNRAESTNRGETVVEIMPQR
ncbi:MAG: antibiotic biosynthesis monooxygenase [Thermomicrobiales bacterium]